ncbi:MAG: ABC transporter ATP-binding protein [Azospirillaceae bacterium]
MTGSAAPLLDIRDLRVRFPGDTGPVAAVDGIDLAIGEGETVAVVGESGSGKSTLGRAVLGLVPRPPAAIEAARFAYKGIDLLGLSEARLRRIRGAEISMIFQEPMVSLDPLMTVGRQITEALEAHRDLRGRAARKEAIDLLRQVGIPHPESRIDEHPHAFSGGMRQRVMIAIAIACRPRLLIADEPTTALDVTVQAQILDLLARLNDEHRMAIVLITHNLGIVPWLCERTMVMYAGRAVEFGATRQVLKHPAHPYTAGLLRALPRPDQDPDTPLYALEGRPPRPGEVLPGCRFAPRCALADADCLAREPVLEATAGGSAAACLKAERPTDAATRGATRGAAGSEGSEAAWG